MSAEHIADRNKYAWNEKDPGFGPLPTASSAMIGAKRNLMRYISSGSAFRSSVRSGHVSFAEKTESVAAVHETERTKSLISKVSGKANLRNKFETKKSKSKIKSGKHDEKYENETAGNSSAAAKEQNKARKKYSAGTTSTAGSVGARVMKSEGKSKTKKDKKEEKKKTKLTKLKGGISSTNNEQTAPKTSSRLSTSVAPKKAPSIGRSMKDITPKDKMDSLKLPTGAVSTITAVPKTSTSAKSSTGVVSLTAKPKASRAYSLTSETAERRRGPSVTIYDDLKLDTMERDAQKAKSPAKPPEGMS